MMRQTEELVDEMMGAIESVDSPYWRALMFAVSLDAEALDADVLNGLTGRQDGEYFLDAIINGDCDYPGDIDNAAHIVRESVVEDKVVEVIYLWYLRLQSVMDRMTMAIDGEVGDFFIGYPTRRQYNQAMKYASWVWEVAWDLHRVYAFPVWYMLEMLASFGTLGKSITAYETTLCKGISHQLADVALWVDSASPVSQRLEEVSSSIVAIGTIARIWITRRNSNDYKGTPSSSWSAYTALNTPHLDEPVAVVDAKLPSSTSVCGDSSFNTQSALMQRIIAVYRLAQRELKRLY